MKKYHCKDCNKEVSDYRIKRCRSCADKEHSKSMLGKNNPSYKFGKSNNNLCIDCKQPINYHSNRCPKCFHKTRKGISRPDVRERLLGKKNPEQSKKMSGKNNPMFGKVTHGKWGKYKNINMRSSYEIAYAKYLNKKNIKWLYESKTFDLGNTTYTPDFYLPESNKYIEIKGFWRPDAKKKFKKFTKLYSKIKIQVLMEKDLRKLNILI